jgi:hypothetical protein
VIGLIIQRMADAVDAHRVGQRPRGVSVDQILGWAGEAGFHADVHSHERTFLSSPEDEVDAIERRAWPALRELDAGTAEEVTRPIIDALRALPPAETPRRGIVDVIVLGHDAD